MTPDFRALCAELLRSLENYPVQPPRDRDLCLRARAALAEQPVGPTDEELREVWRDGWDTAEEFGAFQFARAVLARWGRPAAAPVPETPAHALPLFTPEATND